MAIDTAGLDTDALTSRPPMGMEEGSSFGWYDRLFWGFKDGKVFDYGDWEARDLAQMLSGPDYKANAIERVLALPIVSATWDIKARKGDTGEADWLNEFWQTDPLDGGCKTPLEDIIAQCTSAFSFKRAYFEKVFRVNDSGQVVYDKIAFRPQTTCRLARNAQNGDFEGFMQEAYYLVPELNAKGQFPIEIPAQRSFVHIHGARLNPLYGTSDLEVTYWAWKTKQKILFLWFQFLENVALPRTIVTADDITVAQRVARQIASLKGSGVVPVATEGGAGITITPQDLSGKGADQFIEAIRFLDQAATGSVLAGFLDLTGNAVSGNGPVGVHLAKDASDFFLQQEEAKTNELAKSLRRRLYAPIVRWNLGADAVVPDHHFEPLQAEDKEAAVTMLTDLMRSRDPALVPDEFIGQLASMVATYMGMDGEKVEQAFEKAAAEAKKAAAAQSAAGAGQLGQGVAGVAGAVNVARTAVATGRLRGLPAPGSMTGARGVGIPGVNAPPLPTNY